MLYLKRRPFPLKNKDSLGAHKNLNFAFRCTQKAFNVEYGQNFVSSFILNNLITAPFLNGSVLEVLRYNSACFHEMLNHPDTNH